MPQFPSRSSLGMPAFALLLGALFNGLTALSVRDPAMSQRVPAMAPVMRRVLQVLLAP